MILESFVISPASFVSGVLFGGAVGVFFGTHLARPPEDTKISNEQRGWIFKDLKVETRTVKSRGMTISTSVEERKVAQKVDMKTVREMTREAASFTQHVLRFLPLTNGLRKLLGS